ncbi:MAG TPA: hypothetical protein VEY51_03005 [Chondromyces sp.]|nr:hypothetical protein [Chondromyces sp.]
MMITSHSYIRTIREIKEKKQQYIQLKEQLKLYKDRVRTGSHDFLIEHIYDMSYRPLSNQYGFLYLHTNQGMFSYTVTDDPAKFIEEYYKLK